MNDCHVRKKQQRRNQRLTWVKISVGTIVRRYRCPDTENMLDDCEFDDDFYKDDGDFDDDVELRQTIYMN